MCKVIFKDCIIIDENFFQRNINKIRMNEDKGEKANIPNKVWYARKKMNIVKMKLNGVHPTKITWFFIF